MTDILRFCISAVLMLVGVVIIFSAIFGVFRFRFVMNRMHSAAMIDSLGIGCILLGLMVASGEFDAILKLLAIIALLWIGSPIASHLVSRLEISTDKTAHEHMEERGQDSGTV